MKRFIKSTKDNQDLYFCTFLDCLLYFGAVKNSKDGQYQRYYAAFRRLGFKKDFDFAKVERVYFTFV
tara:strand:- start:168 stop:368 length:201 start_codon:yes stop_codon:yes gene_type:complete